jgi:hypothetical protein
MAADLPGDRRADVCSLETPDNGRRPSSVRAGRALLHADAFMFVHEPQLLEATAATVSACDSAVTQALAYRKARDADPSRPSMIVMTKADGLRYVPPIDGWLRRRSGGPLDLQAIWPESCDVFAYLHHAGASESLAPYREFVRCTLHAASVGGRTEARPAPTPAPPLGRGAMRVIEPLVAILAMVGVIDSPEATLVGRPCEGCALRSPIRD